MCVSCYYSLPGKPTLPLRINTAKPSVLVKSGSRNGEHERLLIEPVVYLLGGGGRERERERGRAE